VYSLFITLLILLLVGVVGSIITFKEKVNMFFMGVTLYSCAGLLLWTVVAVIWSEYFA